MPNIVNYKNDPNVGRCTHCDCPNPYCACVNLEHLEHTKRLAAEHVVKADRYMTLWMHAASCLQHNAQHIVPRGDDEREMLKHAHQCNLDRGAWSGKAKGWIPPAPVTPTTPGKYAQSLGIGNVKDMVDHLGIPRTTLGDMFNRSPKKFRCMVKGVVQELNEGTAPVHAGVGGSPGKLAKSLGLGSIVEMMEYLSMPRSTIWNLFKRNPTQFRCIVKGVIQELAKDY